MENKIDQIYSRRIIRSYSNKKVEKQKIKLLLEAAMAAPSACNNEPWEFVVILEEETLCKIKKCLKTTRYKAPLAIAVCGNMKLARGSMETYWIQDCSAAIENMLLASSGIGLGGVWVSVYPYKNIIEAVSEILCIPEHVIPLGIVHIGYPAEIKEPRIQYNERRIYWGKYEPERNLKGRPKNMEY
ncbi:nitroreductase family protein [Clostridium thermarum]|uniref:nitroreductase family protein n=1 Tax=Clostridium thermarum TaxID=1716543 RepID=UPI001120A5EB|nr:nitroreductase family protein [Clostridium thermarum]